MALRGGDSLSFLSCLCNSSLQLQLQTLLRNNAIASSPRQASSPQLLQQVHCNSNLPPEVSNAVFRLQKQGIQVSPKILHRVKKKEAWKARHRERREREKAGRVTDPVWYDWPEEHVMLEKRKVSISQKEEDGTDEFLSFVDEVRPTRRIVVHGNMSILQGALPKQKRVARVQKWRRSTNAARGQYFANSDNDMAPSSMQSVAQVWRSSTASNMESVRPLQHGAAEFRFPWTGKLVIEKSDASLRELKESRSDCTKDTTMPGFIEGSKPDEGPCNVEVSNKHDCQGTASSLYKVNHHLGPTNDTFFGLGTSTSVVVSHTPTSRFDLRPTNDTVFGLGTSTSVAVSHTPASNFEGASQQDSRHASAATHQSRMEPTQKIGNIDSKYSPARNELHPSSKEFRTAGIEKFLDDEIQEVPKEREVWMKGAGLVKSKKSPFSKEVKEMILARRKGDWSVLYEEEDTDYESDGSLEFHFDGRAALVEDRRIQRLAARLHETNYWTSKVHFSKLMHSGKMKLTEDRVLRIVQILGEKGNWRRAMQVVQWVHKRQHYQFRMSKFVLTTLLTVLGKARRPVEALNVFSVMRENFSSYPDMAAYHALAVILGQAGQLKELLQLIETLKVGPPHPIKFIPLVKWDPSLHPDIVVYNSVLIACISAKEWAGVSWTWEEIKKKGIKPNAATFGLTIEAMVKANNFDEVIRYYNRMERAGFPPNAQTYKSLVEAFGKAKMTEEAVELVKEMEASGTVANASVYFALANSFCIAGRLKEALAQVRKMQNMSSRKSDVITYTGLIRTCNKVGRIQDAIFLFKHMQHTCAPNVRTCNEMIKLYGWNDMFEEARKVYEGVKKGQLESCLIYNDATRLACDSFTFELMLKAAVVSEKWDYFDAVYWDMTSQRYHLTGRTNQWVLLKVARQKKIDIADDMLCRLRKSGEIPQLRLYEAQILSCLQARFTQKAVIYLNNMRIDGYEVEPTMHALQRQVEGETWASFIQQASSLEGLSNVHDKR